MLATAKPSPTTGPRFEVVMILAAFALIMVQLIETSTDYLPGHFGYSIGTIVVTPIGFDTAWWIRARFAWLRMVSATSPVSSTEHDHATSRVANCATRVPAFSERLRRQTSPD